MAIPEIAAQAAYLLMANTGTDMSRFQDNESIKSLIARGLMREDLILTEAGRKAAHTGGDLMAQVIKLFETPKDERQ